MKTARLGFLLAIVLAGCQTVRESDQIRYQAVSREENARAIAAILKCLEQPHCDALLGDHVECGPFLWRQLKADPAVVTVATVVPFTVPQQDASGGSSDTILDGARFDGPAHVRAFWKVFGETILLARLRRFRTLTDQEARIYWTLTRTTIREPVFVVEGERERILMQLVATDRGFALTFIDNLEDVVVRD